MRNKLTLVLATYFMFSTIWALSYLASTDIDLSNGTRAVMTYIAAMSMLTFVSIRVLVRGYIDNHTVLGLACASTPALLWALDALSFGTMSIIMLVAFLLSMFFTVRES